MKRRRSSVEDKFVRLSSQLPESLVQELLKLTPDKKLVVERRELKRSLTSFLAFLYSEGIIAYKPYVEEAPTKVLIVRYETPTTLKTED